MTARQGLRPPMCGKALPFRDLLLNFLVASLTFTKATSQKLLK